MGIQFWEGRAWRGMESLQRGVEHVRRSRIRFGAMAARVLRISASQGAGLRARLV